jgi:hypothetical protein
MEMELRLESVEVEQMSSQIELDSLSSQSPGIRPLVEQALRLESVEVE